MGSSKASNFGTCHVSQNTPLFLPRSGHVTCSSRALGNPAEMASKWSKEKGLHPFNPTTGPKGVPHWMQAPQTPCVLSQGFGIPELPQLFQAAASGWSHRDYPRYPIPSSTLLKVSQPQTAASKGCSPHLLADQLKSANPGVYFPQERAELLAPKSGKAPTNLGRTSWCQRSSSPRPVPVCWACPCRPWCSRSRRPCPGTAS